MRLVLHLRAANLAARRERLATELPTAAAASGERVFKRIQARGEQLAGERIKYGHGTAGYQGDFETVPFVEGTRVRTVMRNTSPHAAFIEPDRPPGTPVLKQYKDTPENRRKGRVGQSYIAFYAKPYGMPPGGIFGDGQPDFARRFVIGRDGTPGLHVFATLREEFGRAEIARQWQAELRAEVRARGL